MIVLCVNIDLLYKATGTENVSKWYWFLHAVLWVDCVHCWGEPILVDLKILPKEMKFSK